MNQSVLPPAIELSQFVVNHIAEIKPIFEYGQTDLLQLQKVLKEPVSILEDLSEFDFPHLLPFMQLLMILGLTVFRETEQPLFHVTVTGRELSIVWSKQNVTRFEFGVYSRGFTLFLREFLSHMLSENPTLSFPCHDLLSGGYRLLDIECQHLKQCSDKLVSILRSREHLIKVFSDNQDLDLFFIVLSSLPTDTLNALYLHIQQFFPEAVCLKTKRGQSVDLKSFFQIPSTDISMLLEKIKIHFNLFFFSESVDVRAVIHDETVLFLSKVLDESAVLDQTMTHIQSVKDDNFGFRLSLYGMFTERLYQLTHV